MIASEQKNITSTEATTNSASPLARLPVPVPYESNLLHGSYSPCPTTKQEVELLLRLRNQVDFYFGPSNLAKDTYLQQLLQQSTLHGLNGAVPVSVIASFPKIRELHAAAIFGPNLAPSLAPFVDPQLLCRAIEQSKIVKLSPDSQWIIPINSNHQHDNANHQEGRRFPSSHPPHQENEKSPLILTKERTTIIVRDLPQHCAKDLVVKAFSTKHVFPKTCRPDVGETWYLTFASEQDAITALAYSQNQLISGYTIRARLKSEHNVPSAHGKAQPSTSLQLTTPPRPPSSVASEESNPNSNPTPSSTTPASLVTISTAASAASTMSTSSSASATTDATPTTLHTSQPMPQQAMLQYPIAPAPVQHPALLFSPYQPYGISAFYHPASHMHAGHLQHPITPQVGYPAMNYSTTHHSRPTTQTKLKATVRTSKPPHLPSQSTTDDTKRRVNKRKTKRNSNSRTTPTGERREQPPQDKPTSSTERREETSPTTVQSNYRNRKRQSKKKTSKMLSEEHFPALTTAKTNRDTTKETKLLYAQALLKFSKETTVPSEDETQLLGQSLKNVAISVESKV